MFSSEIFWHQSHSMERLNDFFVNFERQRLYTILCLEPGDVAKNATNPFLQCTKDLY
jgi:hypothetical protein